MCKIVRKSEKVGRQMCALTFLPSIFMVPELIVTELHTLEPPCGCPVPRVCVALRQEKCRWSRMFSLSYDTDVLDKMTVMFHL